jgi:hypothetical protein
MKKIIPLLLVTIALSACGKLEIKSQKRSSDFLMVTGQNLSPQDFYTACLNKGGILDQNSTICLYEIKYSALANGGYATSDTTTDLPVANIASGTAVKAVGTVNGNSVELVLNGNPISAVPTPANRLITTNGGDLSFRLRPGSFMGVKAFVYGCLNQSMQPVRCPY